MSGSGILIRNTAAGDIADISTLYSHGVSEDELRWALLYPLRDGLSRSFVAVTGGRVVGHAASTVSEYRYGGSRYTGVHPIFWIVDHDHRGRGIGARLMKAALGIGDFSFIIGGEASTHKLYPVFELQFKRHIKEYVRLLDAKSYFQKLGDPLYKRIFKVSMLAGGSLKGRTAMSERHDVRLDAYVKDAISARGDECGCVCNAEDARYVEWLLRCPAVEARAFTIRQGTRAVGTLICYLNRENAVSTGRIVHISYLGSDPSLWNGVLQAAEKFFRDKGCAAISTLASHADYVSALGRAGYVSTNKKGRPFFLADTKNIFKDVPGDAWHLTFAEGDMGYRGV